jgi:pimeloyl-ACP methyl ester carboxylesterase
MWHGAWCWEPFLNYFAERGWAAHALSLRGHGTSAGGHRLRWTRIRHYVDDVISVARSLPRPPVVLGHSMGGTIAQHYLVRNEPLAALVLLSSVPPTIGAWPATVRTARRHPIEFVLCNVQLSFYPLMSRPSIAHDLLFSDRTPAGDVEQYYPKLQDESYLAYLDLLGLGLPRPGRARPGKVPTLVLGSTADRIISSADARRTARTYGADLHIFDGMGHDLMLDKGWERVAEHISRWLAQKRVV